MNVSDIFLDIDFHILSSSMFYLTQKSNKNLQLSSLKWIQVQKSESNYTLKFNEQVIYTQDGIIVL
jgi:hypothetical protein